MSVELYSNDTYVGYLATNSGWNDAAQILEQLGGKELHKLASAGTTKQPIICAAELARLMAENKIDPSVRKTLSNLHSLLLQVKGMAIVE